MEYGRLKPIEGVNGYVPTAFTKKSIKQMLEEEAQALAEEGKGAQAEAAKALSETAVSPAPRSPVHPDKTQAPSALANTFLQQPPNMRDTTPVSVDVISRLHEREKNAAKPRSFLRRLIGG